MSPPVPPNSPPTRSSDAAPTDQTVARSRGDSVTTSLRSLLTRTTGLRGSELGTLLAADQRDRWARGERLTAAAYLALLPQLGGDEAALLGLIRAEVPLRVESGAAPRVEEYIRLAPQYTAALRGLFGQERTFTGHGGSSPTPAASQTPGTVREGKDVPTARSGPGPGAAAETKTQKEEPCPVPVMDLPRLAHYEILDELGRGGMGVVYKARDLRLHRLVALKMILSGAYASPDELVRFMVEAESAAQLQHPHIVPIYEVGREGHRPYFTMELAEGGSLASRLGDAPAPAVDAAGLIEVLARAVHHAHVHGIVHRDLKPANILLAAAEGLGPAEGPLDFLSHYAPKISDFSLAKRFELGDGLTASGAVLGTPCYMAPEQATGHSKDTGPAADVYALGAMLYELLTGRPPFRGTTAYDTIEQVKTMEPVPPTRFAVRLPRDIETITLKCLEKEPRRRYASALDLAEDLRRFREGVPIRARASTLLERGEKWVRRRPTVAALLATLIGMAVLAFSLVTWKWLEAEQARRDEAEQRQQADGARLEASNRAEAEREARTAAEQAQAIAEFEQTRAQESLRLVEQHLYMNRIALAEREWRSNNVGRCVDLLKACPPGLRGWEWHHLQRLCHLDLLTLRGHKGAVRDIAFSADGRRLVSAGDDGVLRVWDAEKGHEIQTLSGHTGAVWALALDPEGGLVASAGDDRTVRIWDLASGKTVHTLQGHTASVTDVVFATTGPLVASASLDGTVRLWDAQSGGKEKLVLRAGKTPMLGVALSPEGKHVAAALGDPHRSSPGEVCVWDAATGKEVMRLTGHTDAVAALAYSPDGRSLAGSGYDRTVRLWDARDGRELAVLRGHGHAVVALAFSSDGRSLASTSLDQTTHLWDVDAADLSDSAPALILRGHTRSVTGVAFHPERPTRLATSAGDGTVRVWDRAISREARAVLERGSSPGKGDRRLAVRSFVTEEGDAARSGFLGDVLALVLSADGRSSTTAVVARDGVNLIAGDLGAETGGGRTMGTLPLGGRRPVVALHHASGLFASLGADVQGNPQLTVARQGQVLSTSAKDLSREGRALAFNPSGDRLAFSGEGNVAKVCEPVQGEELALFRGHTAPVTALAFDSESRLLASGDARGSVHIWDMRTLTERTSFSAATSAVSAVALSRDGTRVAVASSRAAEVGLWDTRKGAALATLQGHSEPVLALAFSPDGRLATAGEDRTVRLWDVALGQELLALPGHSDLVRCLAFSADGALLVSAGRDGKVLVRESARPGTR